jgi:carboxyl-terminal processing protease
VHGAKLGVVELATFSPGAHGEVREAVERELRVGARGIVLDLRANGGGLVDEARLIASIFIDKGTIVSTRGRTQPSQTLSATGGAISRSIPVVVLVDANTASAAEIVTAALQDHHRATVVGTHTFGKGVFQEEEPLSNGGALDITVGEYFTPNGRNLGGGGVKQGAGITPEVRIRNGVDSNRGLDVALSTLAAKVK